MEDMLQSKRLKCKWKKILNCKNDLLENQWHLNEFMKFNKNKSNVRSEYTWIGCFYISNVCNYWRARLWLVVRCWFKNNLICFTFYGSFTFNKFQWIFHVLWEFLKGTWITRPCRFCRLECNLLFHWGFHFRLWWSCRNCWILSHYCLWTVKYSNDFSTLWEWFLLLKLLCCFHFFPCNGLRIVIIVGHMRYLLGKISIFTNLTNFWRTCIEILWF